MPTRGMGQYPLVRYYSWPLQHTGFFKKCIPLVISVCTLVSHMAAFEVLVMVGVRAAQEVNTLGVRRLLSLPSTGIGVVYL